MSEIVAWLTAHIVTVKALNVTYLTLFAHFTWFEANDKYTDSILL
jgi:hypothetical protein